MFVFPFLLLFHLGHVRPNIFREKGRNKKENGRRSVLGEDINSTHTKFQGLSLKNGMDIYLDVGAEKVQKVSIAS